MTSGKGKTAEIVRRSLVARGGWGTNRQSSEEVQGSDPALGDTSMVDTCHYALVQIQGMYTPRMNPDVRDGPWVMRTGHCRLLTHNKYTCCEDGCGEAGADGKPCTFHSNFL